MIIRYTVPEIRHVVDVNFIFHFMLFCSFTSLTTQKIKVFLKKMETTHGDIIYPCVPKIMTT